jgi:stearoyl-CoA desaturase (delta-9 desaturase)
MVLDVTAILEGTDDLQRKGAIKTAWSLTDKDKSSLLSRINWFHTSLLTMMPLAVLGALFFLPVRAATVAVGFLFFQLAGIGITAGYHRLWSHKSWTAHPAVAVVLAIMGAGALEGSIHWWSRNHRAHHRYVDTDKDPYNAKRGFFYSHIGWMLLKQDPKSIGRVNVADLKASPLVQWQHRYYLPLALVFALLLPAAVCSLWDDFWGGFFYAGIGRAVLLHHATFFVNSLAHWWGEKPYSDEHTAYDSGFTALLTFGEGYHNFHHSFPNDYRLGIKWHHFDLTKWIIRGLYVLGLATDLKKFDDFVFDRARGEQKRVAAVASKNSRAVAEAEKHIDMINKGRVRNISELPTMTLEQVKADPRMLVIVDGVVHDMAAWRGQHPGGEEVLTVFRGTDATQAYHGGVYGHSKIANSILATLRVAKVIAK